MTDLPKKRMMTVDEVAAELELSPRVVYRMLQRDGRTMGAIRVGENGGTWRVVRVMFERWMTRNNEEQAWRESSDDEDQPANGSKSTTAGSRTRKQAARGASRRGARAPLQLSGEPTNLSSRPSIPIVRRRRKQPSTTPSTS